VTLLVVLRLQLLPNSGFPLTLYGVRDKITDMSEEPKFTIDTKNKTSVLEIFSVSSFMPFYSYANNEVTVFERPDDINIDIDEFDRDIVQIGFWVESIDKHLSPVVNGSSDFSEEIQKDSSKIRARFIFDNKSVSRLRFEKGDNFILCRKHPEVVIPYRYFVYWYRFITRIVNEIKNF
jgi:hypothetical protein